MTDRRSMGDDPRMYSIARKITDKVLGEGTYNKINHPSFKEMADLGDEMVQINDPGPTQSQGQTFSITEIYAWTVVSPQHGTEGIAALERPVMMPLVGTTRETMEKFRPVVRELATRIGAPIRLRRFVPAFDFASPTADIIDVVEP